MLYTAGTDSSVDRIYFLDAVRGVMMLLGVFIHAAMIYSPYPGNWPFSDGDTGQVFYWIQATITSFRMPVFFVISGFFCPLILDRYGPGRFLSRKFLRIGVPLVSAAVILNSFQQGYLLYGRPEGFDSFASYLTSPTYWQTWLTGKWVLHLWFLICLLVYFVVASLFTRWRLWAGWPPSTARATNTGGWRVIVVSGAIFLILPFINLGIDALAYLVPWIQVKVPFCGVSLHTVLQYAPYFAFGVLCFRDRSLLADFTEPRPYLILVWAIVLLLWLMSPRYPETLPLLTVRSLLRYLLAWLGCALILRLFATRTSAPSRAVRFISDASYTVYLFHHGIVLALGIALAAVDWSPYSKYGAVVAVTLVLTYALHYGLIARVPLLTLLFNGVLPSEIRARRVSRSP